MSPAAERNKQPIWSVFQPWLDRNAPGLIMEVGSRYAQHIQFFASQCPETLWLPTDLPENLMELKGCLREAVENILAPEPLDVSCPDHWKDIFNSHQPTGVFTCNTFHIMPWESVEDFWVSLKPREGIQWVFVYGPFLDPDVATAQSNLDFDQSLRQRIPGAGLRALPEVRELAANAGFEMVENHFMPANNRTIIFERPLS